MNAPKPQELQSLNPKDYDHRIIVAGSRNYDNKREFHALLTSYIERFDQPILFISGAASSGADDMIIKWCEKFKYPCLQMPADWDKYGKSAGFIRNSEMANIATHLLAFHDGTSPGTKHMIDQAIARKLLSKIALIKIRNSKDVISEKAH